MANITLSNLTKISDYMFDVCSSLDGVVLPETLTEIGNYAFSGCVGLTGITIPNTVTNIRRNAFSGCTGITELTLPNGLQTIGQEAFKNMQLQSIVVPNSVTSIGTGAFQGCPLKSITLPFVGGSRATSDSVESTSSSTYLGSPYLFGYIFGAETKDTGSSNAPNSTDGLIYQGQQYYHYYNSPRSYYYWTRYYIPATLKSVVITAATGISANAFYGCTMIESLTLNEGITTIYDNAFYNCTALKSMVLPTSVTEVGRYAFYGCSNMANITLSSLTKINDYTFYRCSSLDGVVLPETVIEVGNGAFSGCKAMASIILSSNLNRIGEYAFSYCTSLTKVDLPNKLATIDTYAFNNCSALSEIEIPDNVTVLEYAVFHGCSALKTMSLPYAGRSSESNQAKETDYSITGSFTKSGNEYILSSGEFTFTAKQKMTIRFSCKVNDVSCISIITVSLNGDTRIASFIKAASYSGKTITLAAGETIRFEFFKASDAPSELMAFVRFDSIEYAEDAPFGSLFGESSYNGSKSVTQNGKTYYVPTSITDVTITKQNRIPTCAFANCSFIENITLNEKTSIIDNLAFYNCSSLKSMVLPSSVTKIGNQAFSGCKGMTSITLSNLTKISDYAFQGCSSLDGVVLPETLTEIGNYAFSGCVGLTGITIPNTVTNIGQSAFSGCAGITELTLPNGLQTIGQEAFKNMQLQSIVVPNNVTSIGASAFQGCSYLKIVHITNGDVTNLTALGKDAFSGAHSSLCIIVPQDAFKAYKEATNWSSYANKIFAENNIVDNSYLVVDGALKQYFGNAETVTIPTNITSIGNYAFAYSNVKSVMIGNSVTTIGQYAFAYCASLQTVTIDDSVTSIGDYAFYNCQKLETVAYGSGLSAIGNYAFAECSELSKINSTDNGVFNLNGNGLKKIGKMAFNNANKATKIIVGKSVESIELGAFNGCNSLVSIELPFIGIDRNSAYSQSQVLGYIFGYETSNKEGTTMQYTNYYYYIPASLREVVITDETVVSKNAFINCSMIESIIIKSDLTSIEDYAFYNCNGLKTITIESNTMPTISAYVFNGDSTVVIKVNSAILSDYQSDANWSKRTLEAIVEGY